MLDLQALNANIQASLEKSKPAFNQDLVLVVGKTGAGKSTLVNYLLRFPMKREEGQAVPLDDNALPPAVMGDSGESVTTYPTAYASQDGFVYCDCPGFDDNRGQEARVCVSVATEAVVKRAKSIQSVITVIEWGTIASERGKGLREVILTLSNLFQAASENGAQTDFDLAKSLLFVITKTRSDEVSPASFKRKIEDLIKSETKQLELESLKLQKLVDQSGTLLASNLNTKQDERNLQIKINELAQKLTILKLIQNNLENVILVNVFDQGQSREAILTRLQVLQPVPIQYINFQQADSVRHHFEELMTGELVQMVETLKQIRQLPKEIQLEEVKRKQYEEDLKRYEEQITDLNSGRVFLGANDPIVLSNKQALENNQVELEEKNKHLLELSTQEETAKKELYALDVTDEVVFWSDQKEKERVDEVKEDWIKGLRYGVDMLTTAKEWLFEGNILEKFLGGSLLILSPVVLVEYGIAGAIAGPIVGALYRVDLYFNYSGGQFTRVEEQYEDGELRRTEYAPDEGNYSAHYESDRGKSAKAKVTIYGEKRNKPDNKLKIEELQRQLAGLKQSQSDIQTEIQRLQITNQKLERFITESIETDKKNLQQKLHELEQLCEDAKKNIKAVDQKIAEKIALLTSYQKTLATKSAWCEMVLEISKFLNFNNAFYPDIVTQFSKLFHSLKGKPSLTPSISAPGKTYFFKAEPEPGAVQPKVIEAIEENPNAEKKSIADLRI